MKTNIYKITCKVNNKLYIGITNKSINHRWIGHKTDSIRDKHNNKFYNALKKHGHNNFNIELIYIAFHREGASKMEQHFIKEYDTLNNGYNSTTGGDNRFLPSEETKEKLRQANLGKTYSKKINLKKGRKGALNPFFGKQHSDQTKSKIGKANSKPMSEQTKIKISNAVSGDKHPYFKGYCLTPWGKFASAGLAAEACPYGIKEAIIYWICHKNLTKKITRKNHTLEFLKINNYIGKTYADFGFGFEAKTSPRA